MKHEDYFNDYGFGMRTSDEAELYDNLVELEEQIEKMKCCNNCQHDYYGEKKDLPHCCDCNKIDGYPEWELRK